MTKPEPICRPLEDAADIADDALFVAPHTISPIAAADTARRKICESILRPEDIDAAQIEVPSLAYVPFWRLEVAVDGMHISFPVTISRGPDRPGIPIPLPGSRHRESTVLVIARRLFPFPPNVIERSRGRFFSEHTTTIGGWHGIEIRLDEMLPFVGNEPRDGELVQPDVTRAQAQHEAGQRARWGVQPAGAIYSSYKPEFRSAACCYYPLYIIRYRYEGHASKTRGEIYWVTISGRTGKIVGSKHPSAIRSVARKLRKLLTFDA